MMECVLTAFLDEYPQYLRTSRKREILYRLTVCFLCFLCGLPMVTNGGFYLLNLMDNYVGGFPLIIVGIGELVAINWVYGIKRFNNDIEMMTGRKAPIYFWIMWMVLAPLLMTVSCSLCNVTRNSMCEQLMAFTARHWYLLRIFEMLMYR